jgi:divalent metal cation (Fe/Co/Zn/Cd) transporter
MRRDLSEVNSVNDTSREKTIIKTSIIGIAANVFLAAFKAVIGLMTHSIAIQSVSMSL